MINLYRFKIPAKPTDPFAFELVDTFANRAKARHEMNQKRHADRDYKFAIYEGNTLISSTY